MPVLIAKFGFLLMKQLCRPLANKIRDEAKQHPFFRQYFCIPPARVYQWMDTRTRHIKIRGKDISYLPLTEEEEVELGANILGEMIVFSLMSIILCLELARQGDKKAVKEKMKEEEIHNVVETLSDMMDEINELKKSVNKIEKKLDTSIDDLLDFEDFQYVAEEPENRRQRLSDYINILFRRHKSDYDEVTKFDPYSP